MAEVFELHDREKFEIIAYDTGIDDNSAIRNRIKIAFDQFHHVKKLSTQEIASQIRKDEIVV